MVHYTRCLFIVPRDQEELFTAELWSAGCLGIHEPGAFDEKAPTDRRRYEVYFPRPVASEPEDSPVPALDLDRWRRRGVEIEETETVRDRDWLAGFRDASPRIEVGRGFAVDPRLAGDPMPDPEHGRVVLRIPAQTAFGTGSHESTRLAVRWLEDLDLTGLDVLDVGAGSGILSFAAEILGARAVTAFDRDSQAVCIARHNARLNDVRLRSRVPRLFAGRLAALRPAPLFDLALVNILPEHILSEIPHLIPRLRPGARVINSGNQWDWRQDLIDSFAAAGLALEGEKRENEWVSFLLSREADR